MGGPGRLEPLVYTSRVETQLLLLRREMWILKFFDLYPLVESGSLYNFVMVIQVLELKGELRLDALPATTIDFCGIRTHDLLHANCVF